MEVSTGIDVTDVSVLKRRTEISPDVRRDHERGAATSPDVRQEGFLFLDRQGPRHPDWLPGNLAPRNLKERLAAFTNAQPRPWWKPSHEVGWENERRLHFRLPTKICF
jgi:hypothetical protein